MWETAAESKLELKSVQTQTYSLILDSLLPRRHFLVLLAIVHPQTVDGGASVSAQKAGCIRPNSIDWL